MKVLHTIFGLSKKLGGPSSCTYQLVKGLRDVGIDTKVLTIASADPTDDIGHDDFIRYVDNDEKTPLHISRNFERALLPMIAEADIIHGNTIWLYHTHQTAHAARKLGKPFVLSPHGMLYPQALRVSAWKKRIILPLFQRRDLERADLLHATSRQELAHIRAFGLTNPVAVIPNALEIKVIPTIRQSVNDKRRFGFVGRLNPIKNIDILLEAWASLSFQNHDIELSIIGTGDDAYEKLLREFIDSHHLTNVTFTGFLSGKQLSDAVGQLDYLVLPSKSENFGMVVPEALIHGVPVIASTGTPWDILPDEQCGWWVDPTPESLRNAIAEAALLPESTRREMGQRGRDLVLKKFSSDVVAGMMYDAYAWLLSGKTTPKPDFVYE